MAKTNRRQHFLAQFYLRNFAEPMFSENLRYYDMRKRGWESRSPRGVGWFRDLCSMIDMEGNRTDEFDQFLKKQVEDPAAPALRKLATGGDIDANERSAVALFVALTAARSPQMMGDVATQHLDGLVLGDRAELDMLVKRWCDWTGQPYGPNSHREFLKPSHFGAIWIWSQSLRDRLQAWNWHLVRTTRDRPFVTSDRPVYAYWNPAQEVRFVSVPISSEVALLIIEEHTFDETRDPANVASAINWSTIQNATEFVVASKDSFPGDEYLMRRRTRA